MTSETLSCFAATAPGLEPLAAKELRALGMRRVKDSPGGASFVATVEQLYAANLWLRAASRVLVRIAEFRATAFYELERNARKIPWERFVASGASVSLGVTCRKSKLYHSGAVAQRVLEAIERKVGKVETQLGGDEDEEGGAGQRFFVRFVHDQCTISADSSGELLHRRGYRQVVAQAPLRETLAAAMLLGAGWRGKAPLLDPMCGSGTIPIEAALLARRVAPGIERSFAFMSWRDFDDRAWQRLRERARAGALARSPVKIAGSDKNAGAIAAARVNAERAGVIEDLELAVRDVAALEVPADGPGLVVTNPPYGKRVGEQRELRSLFQTMGRAFRERAPGWTAGVLVPDPKLGQALGLGLEEAFHTRNGGIPVAYLVGQVK